MDIKVSKKERRIYKDGPVDVLIDNTCDLYPIFGDSPLDKTAPKNTYIMDIEILDDEQAELLDRAMFAIIKQRGNDPLDLDDGIQWSEAVIGEVPAPAIMVQVQKAVADAGREVKITTNVVKNRLVINLNIL